MIEEFENVLNKKFTSKKRLVSGLQVNAKFTIGNYLGALKNFVELQEKFECYYFLADLHSLTDKNTVLNKFNTLEALATYLAVGLNPDKAIIFSQSSVLEHAQLAWILSCVTSMGLLNRMVQFKDKAGKNKEKTSLGLYSYPVLQAADILVYQADYVPVGEDQIQHIELTRNIAAAFNKAYKKEFFIKPKILIRNNVKRIMSLKNARNKMSKSDPSEYSKINLLDSNDSINLKIKKATTDSIRAIYYDLENRPEISNLLTIYSAFSGKDIKKDTFKDILMKDFKKELSAYIIEELAPIRNKAKALLEDIEYLENILQQGTEKATKSAGSVLSKVEELTGLKIT